MTAGMMEREQRLSELLTDEEFEKLRQMACRHADDGSDRIDMDQMLKDFRYLEDSVLAARVSFARRDAEVQKLYGILKILTATVAALACTMAVLIIHVAGVI